jgi:hypothetical protein
MPRIRTIKPQFFKHEGLYDAEVSSGFPLRLAFAGLWTCCDREGRFPWRPRMLKTEIMPYDSVDFAAVLDCLADYGFIVRYNVGGETYGYVPTFTKHQVINNREQDSSIPAPPRREPGLNATFTSDGANADASRTPEARDGDAKTTPLVRDEVEGEKEGEMEGGTEGKGLLPIGRLTSARPEEFANLWNSRRGPLPKVREFTESRRRKIKVRINEGLTLAKFEEAIRRCVSTPFLVGENDRGWQADFDWLIENDTNMTKVMEGKYGNGGNSGNGAGRNSPNREDRLFAAARDAMASVANRTVDDFSDGETGSGCGSEDLGTLRGTVEPIRPAGHRFDGEPVVLSGTR